MFVRTSIAVLAAAFLIEAGVACAQNTPPQQPPAAAAHGHHHGGGMARMLQSLNLSDSQKTQISTIQQKYRQQAQAQPQTAPGTAPTDQAWQARRASMKAERDEVLAVLTPDQKQQLKTKMDQMRAQHQHGGAPVAPGPNGTPLP